MCGLVKEGELEQATRGRAAVDATQGSITKDASSLGPRDPPHELLRRQSTTTPLPAEAMSPHRDTISRLR